MGYALAWCTEYPDDTPIQVVNAAYIIDDRAVFYFIEQGIDGEIPALCIFARSAVSIVGSQNCFGAIDVVLAE